MRFRPIAFALPLALAVSSTRTSPAHACGGCFAAANQRTVVSAHRMAFSITTTQTVLWDQIQYSGDPSEFAWVLPVRSGARIELSRDEWFAALDASTQPVVINPNSGTSGGVGCALSGCAAGDNATAAGAGGAVQVLAQSVVGPYETVTLRSTDPKSLVNWLDGHGFVLPAPIQPTIDAYVAEGFDFIALRLRPQCSERAMKPVRIVTPGADPSLPLRMVAAGVGANVDIVLYVVGEGRWRPENFPEVLFDDSQLRWDPASSISNYESVAQSLMAQTGGTSWLTEGASQPDLGSWYPGYPESSGLGYPGGAANTGVSGSANPGLAPTYFAFCRGTSVVPGSGSTLVQSQPCSREVVAEFGDAGKDAVDAGSTDSGVDSGSPPDTGSEPDPSDADASDGLGTDADPFDAGDSAVDGDLADATDATDAADGDDASSADAGDAAPSVHDSGSQPPSAATTDPCAGFDDIDVALLGAHPQDVWVTRLRARLPLYALANDLRLEASPSQKPVSWVHQVPAQTTVGARQGCAAGQRPHDAFGTGALVAGTVLGLGAIFRRRRPTSTGRK